MGLEAVELIMDVEDEFQIEILDDDYSSLITVGDFHEMVLQKLKTNKELLAAHQPCPCIPAFLATRNAFCSLSRITRNQHRPKRELHDFLPILKRRGIWGQFQSTTKIELPRLILHEPIRFLFFALGVLISCSIFLLLFQLGAAGLVLGVISSLLVWGVLFLLSRPLAFAFPLHCTTIADVVRFAKPPHYPPMNDTSHDINDGKIWTKIIAILSEQLSIPESEIHRKSRFIEDLGVD